jgi:nitrite reductase/ring-hydroxylating ferredoxin subunit
VNAATGSPNTTSGSWWPVAFATEVLAGKPMGVYVDDEPIVLFRDQDGQVRALENRCPHRRAPLSLGMVRAEGWLQCGYHGWSFDGITGRCKAIPNLRADEPVPSTYGVFPYRAAEYLGLIYVAAGAAAQAPPAALYAPQPQQRIVAGRHMVGLRHGDYVAALMDGPHLLLKCSGIRIAETMVIDPHWEDGWLIMERAAFWLGQSTFDAFVREYKLLFRLAIRASTAEAWMAFMRPDGSAVAAAHWAITPAARGTTAVLWQSFAPPAAGLRPALLRAAAMLGHSLIGPRAHVDMAAVARLLAGPSEHWPHNRHSAGLLGDILTKKRATT